MHASIMPVYNPAPVAPVRGCGPWLWDHAGTQWLDCIGGVATNALGHCHPALVRAIKTARRYHAARDATERTKIVGFTGSFHGRTYAAINASGNAAYLDGFGPRMPGFLHVAMDDHAAVAAAIAQPTCAAVIVEPVQGEGGARAFSGDELLRLRHLCDAHGVLLIHDEVQSGMGRTGRLFAHQWFDGGAPDIMAVAKALGAGCPVGACLATAEAASGMTACNTLRLLHGMCTLRAGSGTIGTGRTPFRYRNRPQSHHSSGNPIAHPALRLARRDAVAVCGVGGETTRLHRLRGSGDGLCGRRVGTGV